MDDVTIGNGIDGLSKRSFSAKLTCCQAAGGQTGQRSGQTGSGGPIGHGRRSDRHLIEKVQRGTVLVLSEILGFCHGRSDRPCWRSDWFSLEFVGLRAAMVVC